jgi:hypothetical protein
MPCFTEWFLDIEINKKAHVTIHPEAFPEKLYNHQKMSAPAITVWKNRRSERIISEKGKRTCVQTVGIQL